MGLLTKLLGQKLRIRFEGVTETGETFSGKTRVNVIGVTKEEIENKLKEYVYVETGKRIREVKITGGVNAN
jgi:hypothetical protein